VFDKIYDIEHWMYEAERRWGITYKRKGREAAGSCFACGGKDRFIVFENGGYWCRQCDCKGWVNENQNGKSLSPEILAEIKRKQAEREEWERARHLAAMERMAVCKDHLKYHRNMPAEAFDYWLEQGITIKSMSDYTLGYCPSCPTDKEKRASYTIPVINGNILRNIRHRLIGSDGDKYRPHMAGLSVQLFNMDLLTSGRRIIVVEGAKKAIILTQGGFPAVAVMGQNTFMREWLPLFSRFREVIVALDPDATESAYRLAALFDGRGKVASFPTKPDDALVLYGAGAVDIEAILEQARPVGRKSSGRSRSV